MKSLFDKWEEILRSEGMAPCDGTYTKKSKKISYVIPERRLYRKRNDSFVYEYFNMCERYSNHGSPRWPRVWELYTEGMSWRKISIVTGMSPSQIQYRIEKMKIDMRNHFLSQQECVNNIPIGADILEVFVEEQQRNRR